MFVKRCAHLLPRSRLRNCGRQSADKGDAAETDPAHEDRTGRLHDDVLHNDPQLSKESPKKKKISPHSHQKHIYTVSDTTWALNEIIELVGTQ